MALAPKFKGQRLLFSKDAGAASVQEPLHTIEVFLDYVCPFSAKLFKTLYTDVAPRLRAHPRLATRVQVLFRQQVQPWHPSSTLVHEAAVAVSRLAPGRFWAFSEALFGAQKEYFDVSVVREGRNETYRRLAKLAAASTATARAGDGDGERELNEEDVYGLLEVGDRPGEDGGLNTGNKVTDDLKVLIKMGRLVGVHVSPTVVLDGVVAGDVSSGWTGDQWTEWLEKSVG